MSKWKKRNEDVCGYKQISLTLNIHEIYWFLCMAPHKIVAVQKTI